MPNLSYWEIDSFFKYIDVAIIGSGIVGLNAAIVLKEKSPNLRVLVLERGPLPIGASTRNAGFACFGSISELLDDLSSHDEESMLQLVEKRWKGLERLRNRLGDDALEYKEQGGYELFFEEDKYQTCAEKIGYFNRRLSTIIGRDPIYEVQDNKIKRFGFTGVKHLISNQAEGQLNTGKMMKSLLALARSKGVEIINGTTVTGIENNGDEVELRTAGGWAIQAKKVLVATNGFATKLLPEIAVTPVRNQVMITKPVDNLKVKGTFHFDEGYYYFRNIDNRILFGGGRNLEREKEQTNEFGLTQTIQNNLIEKLNSIIAPNQNLEIDHWWSGILGVGEQKKPIIETVNERICVAVRMGGMGVAIGSLVGEEGALKVCQGL